MSSKGQKGLQKECRGSHREQKGLTVGPSCNYTCGNCWPYVPAQLDLSVPHNWDGWFSPACTVTSIYNRQYQYICVYIQLHKWIPCFFLKMKKIRKLLWISVGEMPVMKCNPHPMTLPPFVPIKVIAFLCFFSPGFLGLVCMYSQFVLWLLVGMDN